LPFRTSTGLYRMYVLAAYILITNQLVVIYYI
jgi:hypothetical protein